MINPKRFCNSTNKSLLDSVLEQPKTNMAQKAMIWFLVARLLLQILQTKAKVPAIIVFGDSSVDSGNNNQISTILKSNFHPYGRDFAGGQPTGRFSNGLIATDFISKAVGIKPAIPAYLDPTYNISDFVTGVCFASAGTGYDYATSDVLSVIPLWKELDNYEEYQKTLRGYLGLEKANELVSEALYLISMGTNDFLENYYTVPGRSSEYSVIEYQNFLIGIGGNFIIKLHNLGARKISIAGLPPMGCLPLERTRKILFGGDCIEEYNNVAKDFNEQLLALVIKLNKELTGIQLVLSNPYDILLEMIQNPTSLGFENAARACCGTGLFEMSYMCNRGNPFTCSDASKYVFWDAFHLTERANGIIADYVIIPEKAISSIWFISSYPVWWCQTGSKLATDLASCKIDGHRSGALMKKDSPAAGKFFVPHSPLKQDVQGSPTALFQLS